MSEMSKRSTIYFDPQLHTALRIQAAHSHRSVSEIVNQAVRAALAEDQEDLPAGQKARQRAYAELFNDLKGRGQI